MDLCPCGSQLPLASCCGPILEGRPAPTALALMRSRYTAYVLGDLDHVERTQADARDWDRAAAEAWSRNAEWLGLEIHALEAGGEADETGTVEFTARYSLSGATQEHRERSRFVRRQGQWLYLEGRVSAGAPVVRSEPKVGRNDPCPCGSGKKFKKCCGR